MSDPRKTAPLAAVILAAGKGTRMKSAQPKVLHRVAGRPLIGHVLAAARALDCARIGVVVAPDLPEVAAAVAPSMVVVQERQLGTGHAVLAARDFLAGFDGDVMVLYGDTPLLRAQTLARLVARRAGGAAPAIVVLGLRPADPGEYGRLVAGAGDSLEAIVEYRDATAAQRAIGLCNSGVLIADRALLFDLLSEVTNANAKGEYYLTDIVGLARKRGLSCAYVEAPADELLGVNSRADLAAAEAVMQDRLRADAMAGGATLIDPRSIYFNHDTRLGRDVTVGPNVVFGTGVVVGDGVEIRAYCHIEGTRIETGATVGPFARLRAGTVVGPGARIGNFVEVKNSILAQGATASHLSYLGDASVGVGTNIGAGTITCNYDGVVKSRTEIGAGAFIGSNTALVAPVKIGDGAIVGAGSVVTRDVPADSLTLARAPQVDRPGDAARYREQAKKDAGDKGKKKE
jgi:bifunctional UDP-N-acetylglucosamine pyrophosphorylase/glucosamine-1-phosphate N-acetyltransferase